MATVIPTDIIFTCILPKLPAKSLIRLKCVSKSFLSEISSRKFIKLHHHNAMSSNTNRILIISYDYRSMSRNSRLIPPFNQRNMNIYDLDSLHTLPLVSQYPKHKTFTGSKMRLVAACENYLLIGYKSLECLVLFNPSTHIYRELPRNNYSTFSPSDPIYGMCHCVDDADYKIIRVVENSVAVFYDNYDYEREIMIYSLKTNKWKFIERNLIVENILPGHNTGVVVQNHLFHLIFIGYDDNGQYFPSRIGCFDIKAEQWADDVPLPIINLFNYRSHIGIKTFDLCSLDGKLCYLVLNPDVSTYDLYIMNDYGVQESWVKLMSIPISNGIENSCRLGGGYHPIAYRVGSTYEVLCRRNNNGSLFWYNLSDEEVMEAEYEGGHASEYSTAYVCKGSLLNFPGGRPIRASSGEEEGGNEDEEEDKQFDFIRYYP